MELVCLCTHPVWQWGREALGGLAEEHKLQVCRAPAPWGSSQVYPALWGAFQRPNTRISALSVLSEVKALRGFEEEPWFALQAATLSICGLSSLVFALGISRVVENMDCPGLQLSVSNVFDADFVYFFPLICLCSFGILLFSHIASPGGEGNQPSAASSTGNYCNVKTAACN